MNYVTNCMPTVALTRLRGCNAHFATHNLTRDTWNQISMGQGKDVAIAWQGNCNHIVNPLMAMGYHCEPFSQITTVDFKRGDALILVDPATGDTYEWNIF